MVLIDKLNIDSALKVRLSSALEKFRKAKESSLNSNEIIHENEVIHENKSIEEEEKAIFSSETIRNKFSEFINNFMYSEYENG